MEIMNAGKNELLAFAGYAEFEAAADRTAVKIKEGYMEMGYILKMARDTDILATSGYAGYEEFADKRYGLDKGTVSRYIRIVERFSVDGNSHVLKENYRKMGFAKLSIMLHMPDAIAEELMDSLSKQEVQEIREELEAENNISDIECAIEQAETVSGEPEGNMLIKAVWQLGREQKELYRKLWEAFKQKDMQGIPLILAPQVDKVYMVRIPGTGRIMISVKGDEVVVTAVRTQEKERHCMKELVEAAAITCPTTDMTVEEAYFLMYDEELEQQEPKTLIKSGSGGVSEVAPVQPKEKRKESKVTKAKPVKKPEKGAEENQKQETQLLGQIEIIPEKGPEIEYREIQCEEESTEGVNGSSREEENNGEQEFTAEIWGEIRDNMEVIRDFVHEYVYIWPEEIPEEYLRSAYNQSINLAAGLEKLLKMVGSNE